MKLKQHLLDYYNGQIKGLKSEINSENPNVEYIEEKLKKITSVFVDIKKSKEKKGLL